VRQVPVLPSQFDPRWKVQTGVAVLDRGLPALPDALDYTMSVPVASWAAAGCAVVVFLEFSRDPDGVPRPGAKLMTFARDGDRWSAHRWFGGVGWSHDPVADPGPGRQRTDLANGFASNGSGQARFGLDQLPAGTHG
jgi:hypothetical protein